MTLQDVLTATGRPEVTTSFALNDTSVALADAMARAVQAFYAERYAERYANNAATIRMSPCVAAEGDYHFFVSRTGSIRIQPCISAEGAHSVEALKALMRASVAYDVKTAVEPATYL